MKWLFIIFALLNIAYGAYNFFVVDDSYIGATKKVFNDKSQIVLLNELDASDLKELQDKSVAAKIVQDDTQYNNLGEDKSTNNDEESKSEEEEVAKQTNDVEKNLCYKLGPFTKKVMNEVRVLLDTEYQNQLSFGIETTSDITYYRIYIPPLRDKAKIKDTLLILDKNGLKDHYVMSIDGRKNAIALGVFKERSAAEKVASKATKIGLSTTIEAISDDKNSLYQLLVIFQDSQETSRYQEIISEKQLISVECDK
ncbi:MAG: hypothetical protein OQL19_12255 [Gammaproteobacteria bacterium]|nr:hypothetical protein [Gammaproteobacteria bacterium]